MRHFFVPLTALLLLLVFAPMHAQNEVYKGELYVGAGGGLLFSKVDFVPGVPLLFKQGVQGGLAAKYISEKNLGLVVELNYAQRGWKEDFGTSPDFSYNRALNYLEIPFMTHVYVGNKTRFIFNAGPQVAFLLGHREDMSQALADDVAQRRAENPNERIGMQYDGMYKLKRLDYGLVGGIGLELRTGVGTFDLEGRYYFGLGDIFTSRRSDKAFFSRSASRVVEVKLTYYTRIF